MKKLIVLIITILINQLKNLVKIANNFDGNYDN